MMNLMNLILLHGGKIVRAIELSPAQRQFANSKGHIFTDAEGNSFAWVARDSRPSSGIGFGSTP